MEDLNKDFSHYSYLIFINAFDKVIICLPSCLDGWAGLSFMQELLRNGESCGDINKTRLAKSIRVRER